MSLRPAEEVPGGPELPAAPPAGYRALARAGVGALALGTALVLLLHVVPPSNRVNPLTRTISEYALGADGWMFDVGVLALALGSVAVLACLVRAGVLGAIAPASWLVLAWSVCLVVLVVFQKYDYGHMRDAGPGGTIHRMASLVAFLCLPAGALLIARAGRADARWLRAATRTRWAAWVSVAFLGLLFYAVGQSFVTEVPWWRVFPLGLMERLIALAEVGVMFCLGQWATGLSRPGDPLGDGGGRAPLVQ